MSQLSVILQESVERERETRTILGLLGEQMDGVDGRRTRRRTLKERLGLKGMGCCGSTWGFRPTNISVIDDDDNDEEDHQVNISDPGCLGPDPVSSGMNLAAALAAERHFRASNEAEGINVGSTGTAPGTPLRASLMRLLEETDGGDGVGAEKDRESGAVGNDSACCVCMVKKKGAAFIPCGHTFCRVCSRELWLNRGSCPLCNRTILEILDLF